MNRYDPMPLQKALANPNFRAALPKGAACSKPADGWPVVIYTPGGAGSATDPLGLIAGFGATTMPHDIDSIADELGARCLASITLSRLNINGTITEAADAYRQIVADLLVLVRTLPNMDLDGDSSSDFATDAIGYIGISSGASQGLVLMALEPSIKYATFGSPEVGLGKSLDGSPLRSPGLESAVTAQKGTSEWEVTIGVIQAAYDTFDPLNYLHLIRPDQAVHLIEIYGGGVLPGDIGTGVGSGYADGAGNFLNPGDLTTPHEILNTGFFDGWVVETAPLAGMEAAVRGLGLDSATATIDNRGSGEPVRAVARFTRGHHSSGYVEVFNGFGTLGVSREWRNQQAEFIASGGLLLPVSTAPEASMLLTDPYAD